MRAANSSRRPRLPAEDLRRTRLLATEVVAFFPWHNPDKIFALLNEFYPLPEAGTPGKLMRDAPYLPYLTFAPSAFVFPLKFTGGGSAEAAS